MSENKRYICPKCGVGAGGPYFCHVCFDKVVMQSPEESTGGNIIMYRCHCGTYHSYEKGALKCGFCGLYTTEATNVWIPYEGDERL